jgi:hypothetical protein
MIDIDIEVRAPKRVDVQPETVNQVDIQPDLSGAEVILLVQPGPQGPKGDQGKPGTFGGTAWWAGSGSPGIIVGSKRGDMYIDTNDGTVYELE